MPSRTFSFWFIWIVPFVSLILVAVGLVGFLSLQNGQRAVNDLAGQLLERTNQLVTQHLESYLAVPKNLVRLNAAALENGTLDWQNFTAIGDYLWQQAKLYQISWINYGLSDGRYIGAGYIPDTANRQMLIGERSPATGMVYYDFFTDEHGQRRRQEADPTYDFQQEAWFEDAMRAGKLGWSDIYLWEGTYSTMSAAISQPIYHGNARPVGAVGIDLALDNISDFLRSLQITPSARIFIVEKNGLVVASSSAEATFVQREDRTDRLNVLDSTDPLIKATATHLLTQIGRFDQIQTSTAFQFPWQSEQEYVQITPWRDELGLTWWVVVVVCGSDFMAQIDANTQQTIWLSMGALLTAIGLGFFTSRLITRRVASLELAAQQIAAGQLERPVALSGIRELDAVGHSFNSMATQLRDSFTKLAYTAAHDTLTGLPNRASLQRLLSETIPRSQSEPSVTADKKLATRFAVLFLDLDYFKLLNDSLGHLAGDQVLIEVARRLQLCVQKRGHVARFGGDEFVILLDPIVHPDDVKPIVENILSSIQKPIVVADNTAFVSTSIGIVFSSHCGADAEGLLRNADIALYRAKSNGKAIYEIFDDEMHGEVRERLQLEMDLRRALYQDELTLYYQPIVDATTLVTTGVEALLRWQHPKQGMILPVKFIPIAEETGLIIPLGWWVLRMACHQMQQWRQQFPHQPLVVNVNLSIRQFLHPDLLDQVRQTLAETGLPPQALNLEITESLLVRDRSTMLARLLQLKALGIQLSLDDFGTGYSSLSYLHHFPLDTLKIDRSFVQQMLSDKQAHAVIESIVTMAHTLGMDVVAEGVETQEALDYLRDYANCEQIQGFLISPAVPAAELQHQLSAQLAMPLYYTNRSLMTSYAGDRLVTADHRVLSCS